MQGTGEENKDNEEETGGDKRNIYVDLNDKPGVKESIFSNKNTHKSDGDATNQRKLHSCSFFPCFKCIYFASYGNGRHFCAQLQVRSSGI